MIWVLNYRIAIVCFLGKVQFTSLISKKLNELNTAKRKQNNNKIKSARNIDTSQPRVHDCRKIITTKLSLIYISVMLALAVRLIIDENMKSNLCSTYDIEKAIHGSYHKGDHRFGNTAGIQCAFNSPDAFCWSQITKSINQI